LKKPTALPPRFFAYWSMSAVKPAQSGVDRLVPPPGAHSPSLTIARPDSGSPIAATSGTPRIRSGLSLESFVPYASFW
jgi:hypothetical protein